MIYQPVNELLTDEATVLESSDSDWVSVKVTYAKKKTPTREGAVENIQSIMQEVSLSKGHSTSESK